MQTEKETLPINEESKYPPLLPCPFCGVHVVMSVGGQRTRLNYQVECDNCGAIAGSACTTETAAIANWNRRT
jgi:Lar family restriction alleviation protein